MFHEDHCNHSYLANANHNYVLLCNDGYMGVNRDIGKRIKRLREELKLSQQQVADSVGVSRVAVTKWEGENTPNLKIDNLLGLSSLFALSIDELVNGPDFQYTTKDGAKVVLEVKQHTPQSPFPMPTPSLHPAISEVLSLMQAMDDIGRGMVLGKARDVADEQRTLSSKLSSSQ